MAAGPPWCKVDTKLSVNPTPTQPDISCATWRPGSAPPSQEEGAAGGGGAMPGKPSSPGYPPRRPLSLRRLHHPDPQLLELRLRRRRRRIRQQARGELGLGERDDVADAVPPREEHRHAVETEGDAAVRRAPVIQRLDEEPELLLRRLRIDPEQL